MVVEGRTLTLRTRYWGLLAVAIVVMTACGDNPLASLGGRSSGWINEPEVTTTTRPQVDLPTTIEFTDLKWFNDGIVTGDLLDPTQVVANVFARREGDRFIQASPFEIATVVPGLVFPTVAPHSAEWVSSQLVIENNGRLSAQPTAAFGIWSAVPYTRSRTVAQMAILQVAIDPETAAEVILPEADLSCARFAEDTTEECSVLTIDDKTVWRLASRSGITLVWFEGANRYELFGRIFVPSAVLEEMAGSTVPLTEILVPGSTSSVPAS